MLCQLKNYGSALWKPSKGDLGTLESIQRKAVSWIFITNNISYKDKLVKLDIHQISFYQELHVILLFAKILAGKVDIDWRSQVTIADIGTRRTQAARNFACQKIRLKKCESDYCFRACRLANIFNDYFKFDIIFDPGCKIKLLEVYTKFFKTRYNESDSCTWRILCGCNNCRDLRNYTLTTETRTLNLSITGFYANPWISPKSFVIMIVIMIIIDVMKRLLTATSVTMILSIF